MLQPRHPGREAGHGGPRAGRTARKASRALGALSGAFPRPAALSLSVWGWAETTIWVKRCNFCRGHRILTQSLPSLYAFLTNKFGNQSVSGKFL